MMLITITLPNGVTCTKNLNKKQVEIIANIFGIINLKDNENEEVVKNG